MKQIKKIFPEPTLSFTAISPKTHLPFGVTAIISPILFIRCLINRGKICRRLPIKLFIFLKRKTIIITCLAFVVLSNFWPVHQLVFWKYVDKNYYKYSNADGRWRLDEDRGVGVSVVPYLKTLKPSDHIGLPNADSVIYRNFKKSPFAFWRYYEYLFDPIYKLPYKSRKDLPFAQENTYPFLPPIKQ